MKRRVAGVAALVVVSALLAGCAGPSGTRAPSATAEAGYGTRTVADCAGTTSTFTAPPARVATITGSVLELLLALGLKDKIAGIQAVGPGQFSPDLEKIANSLPTLSGPYVPNSFVPVQREQLLAANPDFVIGGWPSNFDTSKGALSQAELTQRDINSYFSYSANCTRTAPVTDFSVVYKDLENYGKIFDIEPKADALVSEMKNKIADLQKKVGGLDRPKVFVYSWEDEQGAAYATGNQDLSNAAIIAAGGQNIFSDVNAGYKEVSWEDVVARNPDVIVITPYGKATKAAYDQVVAKAEAFFTSNPALKNVTAVKNRNFVVEQYEAFDTGSVRNADTVESLAKALHPHAFGK